jgi:GT2 family glycosyltransferase
VFVAFDRAVRVSLGVISLGAPARLTTCLEALCAHASRHDFTVVAVVNSATVDGAAAAVPAPAGVLVDPVPVNLGWSGGLHRARECTDAELLVWVQDDMLPTPGWLDALVDAADIHPRVGGFGSVRVDTEGRLVVANAGSATPHDAVQDWTVNPATVIDMLPADVTTYDWVTSTGFLTRSTAWDELGGTDPRFWPVNHGDKDYCTHLRSHGWDVALVPTATVQHEGAASAPMPLRTFVSGWREPWFNRRWSAVVAELRGRSSAVVTHTCADWRDVTATAVEVATGAEASRMLVPLGRALAAEARASEETLEAGNERLREAEVARDAALQERDEAFVVRDRARRRARRLRRRLRALEQPEDPR